MFINYILCYICPIPRHENTPKVSSIETEDTGHGRNLTVFKIMLQRFNEVKRINFDVHEDVQHLDALSPIHRYQTTVTVMNHEIAT